MVNQIQPHNEERTAYLRFETVGNQQIRKKIILKFALQSGFSDGYENRFMDFASMDRAHPRNIMWRGGKVKDLRINLDLAVGVDGRPTPEDMINTLNQIRSLAIPPAKTGKWARMVEPVLVTVHGKDTNRPWFERTCVVKDIDDDFMQPWDMQRGIPMHVKVSIVLMAHFLSEYDKDVTSASGTPSGNWSYLQSKTITFP